MGYFRILAGHNSLGIEMEVAWATPGQFTVHNFPCYEDGANCAGGGGAITTTQFYEDPSTKTEEVKERLLRLKQKDRKSSIRG